jgi:hypothetical protein
MLYGTEMNFMPNSVKFCLSYGMKLSLISAKFGKISLISSPRIEWVMKIGRAACRRQICRGKLPSYPDFGG